MRVFSISVLFVLLCNISIAQVHEISLAKKKSENSKLTKTISGLNFSFNHDKLLSKTVTTKDGGLFTDIWVNGSYTIGEVGMPKLPAYKKLIRIPKGSNPVVKVISYSEQIINLKEKGIDNPIYPNQPSVRKDQDSTKLKFEIKKDSYSKNSFSNTPIATIEVLGNLRSATIARLVVSPIDYNPGNGTIKVYNDINVDVNFEDASNSKTTLETNSPYFDIIYNSIEGTTKSSYTDHPDLIKYPVKMLIVSNRMFEETLQPFIAWKKLKGFNVITAYTDVIGTTSTSIKTYIQNIYNSATEYDPAPSFLVLVGDVDQVPASETGSFSGKQTDLYYASTDGDMFPEMYFGRLSATTPTELENIINKILYYEKYQFADPSYLNNTTLIAGYDGTWTTKIAEPTIKYATANYFNASKGFSSINEYGVASDPNNASANSSYTGCYSADKISVGFINYTAHGSETSWQDPVLNNSSIATFTNANKYPLVIGNCCLSGDFGTTTCFGEAWIRAQNKGAVTYIGSSPSSYWKEDMYWSVGAFPMVGDNNGYVPTFNETTTGAYDASFGSSYITTGAMVFAGNLAVTEANIQSYSSQSSPTYYWQAYNILGDPSLVPYHTAADSNQVIHNKTITIGESSFLVRALPNSYIAMTKDDELIGTSFVTASGEVSVPITITSTGDITIVITRPQTIPYFDTITAIPPTGPYLTLNSFSIDDGLSNNNGKADYSETFSTNIKIKNIGIDSATNVRVKILGSDDYISVNSNDSISVSDISNNEGTNFVDVNSAFSFTTQDSIPDQHIAHFTLKFYSDQGIWISKLNIPLNFPVLSLGILSIDDSTLVGNGDGLINPGETCKIQIQLLNKGHAVAKNITFQVSVPDSLQNIVSISGIQTEPFSLEANSLDTLRFDITVASDIHLEPIIPIILQALVVEPSTLSQTLETNLLINNHANISNDTLNTCSTYFYDSGGKAGNYKNAEDYTITFVAKEKRNWLKANFTEFYTESGYDTLSIFDGADISSPQIEGSPFSGTTLPNEIISTGRCLTFRFKSDNNTNYKGWAATIECIEPEIPACVTTPSPSNGELLVQSTILTWDSQNLATFYDVYIGSSPNALNLVGRVDKPKFTFVPEKNTTYYWQVVPGNSLGLNNASCNIWNFITDTISNIVMSNNSLAVDTIMFYDSGGSSLNYENNENYTLTFRPKYSGNKVNVKFLAFVLEEKNYDKLTIYDGLTTSSPLIGIYSDTNSPETVEATNTDGALTFHFESDDSDSYSGWKALVKSVGANAVPIITSNQIRVYPNPVSDILTVDSEQPITRIAIVNMLGSVLFNNSYPSLKQVTISIKNFTEGIYIFIIYNGNSIPKKVMIIKK